MTSRGHHGLLLADTVAPSGFPQLLSITQTSFASAGTSHAASMPAVVNAGDLLVAIVSSDGSSSGSAVATPSGWTAGATAHVGVITVRLSVFYMVAAGTEGGTTVNFATTDSEEANIAVFRYAASTVNGAVGSAAQSNSSSMSPPSPTLAPSWGNANNGWIVAYVANGGLVTSYPLTGNQAFMNAPSAAQLAYATQDIATGSLSPANWGRSVNATTGTATIAIRPA